MPDNLWRENIWNPVALYRVLSTSYPSLMRIVRFVVSGGTATAVNLGILFVLTHLFGLWYLLSSVIAFLGAFFVSFTMQKYWTFEDDSTSRLRSQALIYLSIILVGLGVNTALIYSFVEYARLHYVVAQLISGIFIAVMNYFSYKHLVFREAGESVQTGSIRSVVYVVSLGAAVILFGFLASYRLPENPPTWLDEGSIIQVSMNLARDGTYGIETAPGRFVSTDFLTTSFPVIYPVAASFALLGTNILSARIVMVLFMGLLCVLSYLLIRSLAAERKRTLSLLSLFLLVTFAPLYGHGKNVLGEVPGLMFFVASLLAFHFAQKRPELWPWIFSGVLAGLSMATKPIYLFIIVPSALLIFLLQRKYISLKNIYAYAAGAAAVLLFWFFIHVGSIEALKQILFAANAENSALSARLLKTGTQFISELQPMYFLGLLLLWWGSMLLRHWHKVEISSAELYAGIFSAVNFVLYLASRGFYRYFFPAEVLALIFLPLALYQVPLKKYRAHFLKTCTVFVIALVFFQGYQTLFHSWISEYKDSTRSALLSENLRDIPKEQSVFFYNVPEAVIFLPSRNYYQYLRYGDNVIRGGENLPLLFAGNPDFVLVDQKFPYTEKILQLYGELARFDKYVLYEKTPR